jgi:fibronectin type 3 domain-containing protein
MADAFHRPDALPTTSRHEPAAQRSRLPLWLLVILVSLLFAQMNRPVESQVSGLIAAYSFNEGTGLAFADASGKGNAGTVSGATWAAGHSGSALSFDGINDIATVPDSSSLDLTTGMTQEAWVYLVSRTNWRTVLMKERPGHLVYGMYANTDTNRPSGEISIASGPADVRGTAQLPLTTWTHLAVTHDGATLKLFVNGVQVGSRALSGAIVVSGNPLRIGGNSIWGEYFSGRIDDVRIYNRALTATQIQADMNAPVAPPDTIPPTAAITSPTDGSTVPPTVTVTANASDNVGVSGVQFLLDGLPLGIEDTSSPYSVSWDTRASSNTTHRLSARVRDAAGNTAVSTEVAVTVSNPPKLIITTPAPGSTVSGSTVSVAYTTTGDLTGVDHVHFRLDSSPEVMDLTFDGAYALSNVPQGAHVLNGYLVRVNHSKIIGTDAAPVSFSSVIPDTTPPAVLITSPSDGSTVAGTVTVTADASDNAGVAAVQFLIDGSNLGLPDTEAPYAAPWQSTGTANGSHTLSAIAYDASNNQAPSNMVAVVVSNTDTASQSGQWSSAFNWPLVSVHAALLYTGQVLLWDAWEAQAQAKLWNPATNAMTNVPSQAAVFGSAHSQLADGRLLVVGGHAGAEIGIRDVNLFDPLTRVWTNPQSMSVARWRPGITTLGDGRVLAVSGQTSPAVWADTPEIYDPATNAWTSVTQISNADTHDPEYPFSFLAPDGKVGLIAATNGQVRLLDLDGGTSIDAGSEPRVLNSTVAMYRPGRILATGGGDPSSTPDAQTTASVIDFSQPSPAWRAIAPMASARYNHNLVVLADGSVLAVGGAADLSHTSATGVLAAEIWDPATETWHTMAAMRDRRIYQSTAVLLPDGRVLVAGGGRLSGATDFPTAEIFSPPYLFKGPRPTIAVAPALIPHGATMVVETPQAPEIGSVVLIRLGSVTHASDMGQRYVELAFTAQTDRLIVTGPAGTALAPPGYYMLVIVNRQGVPSTASFVRLPSSREDVAPPTPPSGLTATGAVLSASLNWTAATDNRAVTAYNVHRSSQQGFTPSMANRIGRSTATSFADSGLSGTYYYRVTAEDAAGNVGGASNEARADIAADTTPPSVAIGQPQGGSTITGLRTIDAAASDNVSVAGVRLLLDGVDLAPEFTTAPYSLNWDSRTVVNGLHQISAIARDTSGNQSTSAVVSVTVANTPSSSLVAAFGFSEGAGTAVGDSSGNNNGGTISGAAWAAGRFGQGLVFDGVNDLVSVPDSSSLDLSGGMTLEAWVRPANLSGWRMVTLKETSDGLAYALYANNNAPQPAATIKIGTTSQQVAGTNAIPLNTWTHLAATYDGVSLRIYVNGSQVGSRSLTGPIMTSDSPLRIGGNIVWGEYFGGVIDEVRVYNRALTQTQIQTDMNTPVDSGAQDTTPPAITRTVPASGAAAVSPAANLSVTFTEPIDSQTVGTSTIELRGPNNQLVAATVKYDAATRTARLDPATTLTPSTTYTATVKGGATGPSVKDVAGNPLASTTTWPFTTNADTVPKGQWGPVAAWPSVAVHMTLLHTGKVLIWQDRGGTTAYVGDPVTGAFTSVPTPGNVNIYCSGLVTMADGRVAAVGGHGSVGLSVLNIFNPVTQQWTAGANMSQGRWYPSALALPDGKVLAISGGSTCYTCYVDVPEAYDPVLNTWTRLTPASFPAPYYPFTFVAPDGRVIYAGASEKSFETRALNLTTRNWALLDPFVTDGGTAAMYVPGKIIKSGTARDTADPVINAAPTTYLLDTTQASPAWRQTLPMAYPRTYHNMVVLPDGSVLTTGGELKTDGIDLSQGVLNAELWSPDTESWTTMAAMQTPRLYHSTSVLLPDGRVVAAGGGAKDQVPGATDEKNAEIYSPPYLFRGPRPTITSAPSVVPYGSSFSVTTPDAVAAVSLVRPGATTHAFDENQRFLKLSFQTVPGGVTVQAPANGNLAPPGYYMLFILNSNGVPSVARFVRLPTPAEDSQPPTAPSGLTAAGSVGAVSLSWTASSDNVGVQTYGVHRSTTAGFAATPANRVAQPVGTSYTDSPPAAGTYFYRVTAQDAVGNTSAPSNEATATVTSDATPPAVNITAPAPGASVTGSIAVNANATDNATVAGVQFLLDGAALGAEDTSAPYSVPWNTASAVNGSHTLTARARDAAGNQTTSGAVSVTVSNTATPGLVASFGFNEGSGTTVFDSSGSNNNGTLTSATWTATGKFGSALSFNGTSSWVTVSDAASLDLTNGLTLEAWVNPTALSGWRTALLKESAGGLSYSLYANDNTPNPAVTVSIGGGDRSAVGTSQVPLNTWTHLAATYDGAQLRLYMNGVQVGSRAQTGNMAVSAGALRVGGNAVWGEFFAGLIDEVRVYNRALTAAEIQADMNAAVK